MASITKSEIGPNEIWLQQGAAKSDDRDRRGATGLANGLAISLIMWALIALAASALFG